MIIRDLIIDDFEQYNNIMLEIHNLHANSRPDIYKAIGKPTDKRAWDFEKSLTTDNMELFEVEDTVDNDIAFMYTKDNFYMEDADEN